MKYYSEQTKKFYDTEADLVEAEQKSAELKEKREATKKELAKKVESADARVEAARDAYKAVQEEIDKIVEEANQKIKDLIEPAKKEIKDAEYARAEAIREFNSKYGVYTTTYSGDRAIKEYERFAHYFDNAFKNIWDPFKWLW